LQKEFENPGQTFDLSHIEGLITLTVHISLPDVPFPLQQHCDPWFFLAS
jgi:hypothetical protein